MSKPYYYPLNCETDFHKSVYNKQDLLYLVSKYGKNKDGINYKKSEFKSMSTLQIRQIWWRIQHSLVISKGVECD